MVHLLSEGARNAMEPFVTRKVEQMKERKLVEWDPEAARSRLKKVLLNGAVERKIETAARINPSEIEV
ncbi:hypothetical protein IFR05_002269 [Cadophora sp. M221]|nr:hypothetical protein IFR05_002269 [Cadophora sp. M221]